MSHFFIPPPSSRNRGPKSKSQNFPSLEWGEEEGGGGGDAHLCSKLCAKNFRYVHIASLMFHLLTLFISVFVLLLRVL